MSNVTAPQKSTKHTSKRARIDSSEDENDVSSLGNKVIQKKVAHHVIVDSDEEMDPPQHTTVDDSAIVISDDERPNTKAKGKTITTDGKRTKAKNNKKATKPTEDAFIVDGSDSDEAPKKKSSKRKTKSPKIKPITLPVIRQIFAHAERIHFEQSRALQAAGPSKPRPHSSFTTASGGQKENNDAVMRE